MALPKFYTNSPIFFQNILISFKGWLIKRTRFNNNFHLYLKEFETTNPSKIKEKEFRTFLKNACKSRFWKNRFEQYNIDLNALDILGEIQKLPILTKEEVLENIESIRLSSLKEKVVKVSTSGTTGNPMNISLTRSMENKQWAVWWRYRKRFNITLETWSAWFGGKEIIAPNIKSPPFWRYNHPGKQIMFSVYHLNLETAPFYYRELKKKKIRWIHGFPSQISLLAGYIKELELGDLPHLSIITYGSENLFEHQKQIIEESFGVPIVTHYGLAEGVSNISQLPDGSFMPDQDFAYTELLPIEDKENQMRIVGTNYSNSAFPLIRYDTQDIATVEHNDYNELQIVSIDGRADDYVIRPDGVKVAALGFIFRNEEQIKEAQIYQPNNKEVVFRVVPRRDYNKRKSEKTILQNAQSKLGTELSFSFEYLSEIPKTQARKMKFVISDIN